MSFFSEHRLIGFSMTGPESRPDNHETAANARRTNNNSSDGSTFRPNIVSRSAQRAQQKAEEEDKTSAETQLTAAIENMDAENVSNILNTHLQAVREILNRPDEDLSPQQAGRRTALRNAIAETLGVHGALRDTVKITVDPLQRNVEDLRFTIQAGVEGATETLGSFRASILRGRERIISVSINH